MKKVLLTISCLALMVVLGGASEKPLNAERGVYFTIANGSDYAITEFHLSPCGYNSWGPNLLEHPIAPGESIVVVLDCGNWDVLVIDEDGIGCDVRTVPFCDSDHWVIPDLTACH